MLQWPNPNIPENDFVPEGANEALFKAGREDLDRFQQAEVLELGTLDEGVEWIIGKPLERQRINETEAIDPQLKPLLSTELAPQTIGLLEDRSRLDTALWEYPVRKAKPELDSKLLAEASWTQGLCRYVERKEVSLQ